MSVRYVVGDALEVSRSLPDSSVDLVVTSPPFLGLRSYLPAGHPDKGHEMGSEATPGAFLDVLLDLVEEWDRVLAPHGSIAVELGDTYAGGGSDGEPRLRAQRVTPDLRRDGDASMYAFNDGTVRIGGGRGWPLPKSLCLVPQSFAFALAYGRNPHTGRETPPWRVRNWITWGRPNPPVGALGDKVRPASSFFTVACKSASRYFDLDAVREDVKRPQATHRGGGSRSGLRDYHGSTSAGAPPLDWWADPYDEDDYATALLVQATEPYSGAHYACWPRAVAKRLVDLLCPRKVCRVCGEPSRRIVGAYTLDAYRTSERTQTKRAVALADQHALTDEHIAAIRAFGTSDAGKAQQINSGFGKNTARVQKLAGEAKAVLGGYFREFVMGTNASPGSVWSDCGHDDNRPGCVFDPFAGTGATLAVASGAGLDAIGCDIDSRNADLALDRVGPLLLTVER